MINEKSDKDLIRNLKVGENINESLSEIINRHSGIFITMVNAYTPQPMKQEIIEDKNYYIYQTALKYDESRNTKFSTYLGSETRWMCLNNYNKSKKKTETDLKPLENLVYQGDVSKEVQFEDSLKEVLKITKTHPDKRVGKIFQLRYGGYDRGNKLMPWSKVSKHVGLSVQGSINVHDQAIESIKVKLEKEI